MHESESFRDPGALWDTAATARKRLLKDYVSHQLMVEISRRMNPRGLDGWHYTIVRKLWSREVVLTHLLPMRSGTECTGLLRFRSPSGMTPLGDRVWYDCVMVCGVSCVAPCARPQSPTDASADRRSMAPCWQTAECPILAPCWPQCMREYPQFPAEFSPVPYSEVTHSNSHRPQKVLTHDLCTAIVYRVGYHQIGRHELWRKCFAHRLGLCDE